jgi:Glycoside Hydrolase Family 113
MIKAGVLMRRSMLFLPALMILVCAGCLGSPVNLIVAQEKQKGICYSCWWEADCYSHIDSDISLRHLAETGAEWISITVNWHQDSLESTRIYRHQQTLTDEDLIHVISLAHSLGLKVMLRPTINISHGTIGEIGQAFTSESQWSEWFSSYRTFIEYYAGFAAAQGLDQFCVGTELKGTTDRAADWRAVVAAARSRYTGPLTYAANDRTEASITWWDALDFIGIEAYYPLSTRPDPTLRELKASWRPIVGSLASLSAKWNKPILFTEIGYRSVDQTAMHPAWREKGTLDPIEQADCYQAAFESIYREPWFAGMYWWSWSPNPGEGGPDDSGFSPHDKPAEKVLRYWYGGSLASAPDWIIEPNPERRIEIISEGLGPDWQDVSWGAERDFAASDESYEGQRSLRVRLDPGGSISVSHPTFYSYMYYFLQFYVRYSEGPEPLLWAYFYDEAGNPQFKTPVNDPRYIDGGHIKAGTWSRVLIPLGDMGVGRSPIARLSLQDRSGRGTTTFWIDNLWLIGANWRSAQLPPPKEPAIR